MAFSGNAGGGSGILALLMAREYPGRDRPENWADRQRSAKPETHDNEPDSICWTCLRRTWACLCSFPAEVPPGLATLTAETSDGPLQVVCSCGWHWPDGETDKDSGEGIGGDISGAPQTRTDAATTRKTPHISAGGATYTSNSYTPPAIDPGKTKSRHRLHTLAQHAGGSRDPLG